MPRFNIPNSDDLASVPKGVGASRIPFSNSDNGSPIYIPKSWTAIHIPNSSTALDEVYLWASKYCQGYLSQREQISTDMGDKMKW